jgi:thiamine biosynthesis lipoprotein
MNFQKLKLTKAVKPVNFIIFIFAFYVFISFVFLTGCTSKDNSEPVSRSAFMMGTLVKLTIHDPHFKDETVFDRAFARIAEIESKMTINAEGGESEIVRLNNFAGQDFLQLSSDTFYVLKKAVHYSEISGGKFDVTIGPLVKLWNIGTEEAAVPTEQQIAERLPLVNYQNLILDEQNSSAILAKAGMLVDLGAIAKGYAADELAKIFREAGVKHAIINLGGNILTINQKPDGSTWKLGLQDPLEPRGDYMGIVMLKDQTLVSSGTYERYFETDGKRYHHLINPQTGYPENNSLMSVSIIGKHSIDADALSTAVFLLGLEKGLQLIESLPDYEAIFITTDKKVYVSSGINAENFQITKEEYQLQ